MKFPMIVVCLLLWMGYTENAYFGWNLSPKSDAEMICDVLILGFCCIACAMITTGKGKTK